MSWKEVLPHTTHRYTIITMGVCENELQKRLNPSLHRCVLKDILKGNYAKEFVQLPRTVGKMYYAHSRIRICMKNFEINVVRSHFKIYGGVPQTVCVCIGKLGEKLITDSDLQINFPNHQGSDRKNTYIVNKVPGLGEDDELFKLAYILKNQPV